MIPLYEMLASQNPQAIAAMGRQFGLSPQQTEDAVAALLPAFSQGLKRNASDPYGAGAFLQALASGRHGRYFDDPGSALSAQGRAEGDGILGHLFGSKEVSRAVAAQASQATGIGADVLKQMLPALAAMIMGGLFKQSNGQMAGAGGGLGDILTQMLAPGGAGQAGAGQNPLGGLLEGMFGGQASRTGRSGGAGDNPLGGLLESMLGGGRQAGGSGAGDNPLGGLLESMLGGGQGAGTQPAGRAGAPQDNPLGQILEQMLGQGAGRQATEPSAQQDRGGQGNPYDELFGKMFETGRQQRDDYQKGVESIFDQFTRGMDRRR